MLYSSLFETVTNRRHLIQSVAGAGAMAAGMAGLSVGSTAKAATRVPIDFKDPAQNLKAFIKMTADLDGTKESVGWFGGTIYGNRGVEPLKPLVGVSGVGMMRVKPMGDNVYRVFNREFATYTDPKTGEILESWKNPYTEETVDVVPIKNMIVNAQISPIVEQDFDGHKVKFPFTPPWIVQTDKAFQLFEVHAAFPNPMKVAEWPRESAGPINRTGEMFSRMCSLAELEDPDVSAADYVGTWTRVGPWLPWMLMGQADGHLLYRSFMNRTGRVENLPPTLLSYMEKKYPEFLKSPGDETWGKPNDSSWTVYMSQNKPKPPKAG
ncbi:MAG: DUF1838 domain-containing protein [Alphaproteobacteria bacterium]|nr:DUF1838 domain-containing protein [Alphaproteobacteria bacterium]